MKNVFAMIAVMMLSSLASANTLEKHCEELKAFSEKKSASCLELIKTSGRNPEIVNALSMGEGDGVLVMPKRLGNSGKAKLEFQRIQILNLDGTVTLMNGRTVSKDQLLVLKTDAQALEFTNQAGASEFETDDEDMTGSPKAAGLRSIIGFKFYFGICGGLFGQSCDTHILPVHAVSPTIINTEDYGLIRFVTSLPINLARLQLGQKYSLPVNMMPGNSRILFSSK